MFRNFSFQNSLIVTRCLKSCFYRTSDNECCFYILEVSTIKNYCIDYYQVVYLFENNCWRMTLFASGTFWFGLGVFWFGLGFFGLDIYSWNFNNVFISDL